MGCKCQMGDKSEFISGDMNFENVQSIKAPISTRLTPIKQMDDREDLFSTTKNTSYTEHYLIKNQKIDKIFLCQELLNEINEARERPKSYIAKIEKYKQSIYHNDKGAFVAATRHTSISLRTGLKAFEDCIDFLNEQPPLPPLKLVNELQLSFSTENSCDRMLEYEYLGRLLLEKKEELSNKYDIHNFHYDKNICLPEFSCTIQIIDDTGSNCRRRKNIFHKDSTVVGINCEKINGTILCYYLLFGTEIKR